MASGLVHDIHGLIVFGFPYGHVNRKKDAPARRAPGLRHRRFRHNYYCAFGKTWSFEDPFPDVVKQRIETVDRRAGCNQAEAYMVSISHDYLDKVWDFDGLSREDRVSTRKYWEGFYVWLLLNPQLLKDWAGVDVVAGRIHRLINGNDVWEEEPELRAEYKRLYNRARFLLRCDKQLRRVIEENGGLYVNADAV